MVAILGHPGAGAGAYAGYQIGNSMLLDGSSDYITWTPGSAGDDSTRFVFSCLFKRCASGKGTLLNAGTSSSSYTNIGFQSGDALEFVQVDSSTVSSVSTSKLFRDFGSWYHLVVIYNSNEASSDDRIKVFVNGVQQTLTHTNSVDSARAVDFASTDGHSIGRRHAQNDEYFNGYIAEVTYLDGGTASDATDFGEFHADTGAWRPISASPSYGSNGYFLDFADASPNLGDDESGNTNDWTESGSPAQSEDSPTKNYATWNGLDKHTSGVTLSNGALGFSNTNGSQDSARATIFVDSGKWYWEITMTTGATCTIGIGDNLATLDDGPGNASGADNANSWGYRSNDGDMINLGSLTSYGNSYTTGDVIGVALDMDTGAIWFSKNGTWQNSATVGEIEAGTTTNAAVTGLSGKTLAPMHSNESSAVQTVNFGQSSFSYTAPDGFNNLTAANINDPAITKPSDHFDVLAYTGNGTAIGSGGKAVSGADFQPDVVWIKNRDQNDSHHVYDAVRGVTNNLHTDTVDHGATDTEGLSTFDSGGFTVGNNVEVNTNTEDYISALWKANGAGSSNSDGSITSTVSVNDDAGISIISYQGTGANATVGHGQSAAPELLIGKKYAANGGDGTRNWPVWHKDLSSASQVLLFNLTYGEVGAASYFNSTDPTSSVFSIGTAQETNFNGDDYVFYAFRSIPGFSKVFSFNGNANSDGRFIYLGFEARWVLIKPSTRSDSWLLFDTVRSTFNVIDDNLKADSNGAEATDSLRQLDINSNGLKIRSSHNSINDSGHTYIGVAFAKHPFGGSNLPLALAA